VLSVPLYPLRRSRLRIVPRPVRQREVNFLVIFSVLYWNNRECCIHYTLFHSQNNWRCKFKEA
jgi:hypothetical protein